MSDHPDGSSPSPSGSPEIVKTIFVRATPEQLFPFFTDPAKMLLWIGTEVDLDARPGGTLRIVPNRVDVIRGTYLEITPPTRRVPRRTMTFTTASIFLSKSLFDVADFVITNVGATTSA